MNMLQDTQNCNEWIQAPFQLIVTDLNPMIQLLTLWRLEKD
jgi:hypothetical protein